MVLACGAFNCSRCADGAPSPRRVLRTNNRKCVVDGLSVLHQFRRGLRKMYCPTRTCSSRDSRAACLAAWQAHHPALQTQSLQP
eukprot:4550297-Lingulodinium_polyedra.AAC.1